MYELYPQSKGDDQKMKDETPISEINIYWDDLTPKAQQEILNAFGDNCNFDILPIATISVEDGELEMTQQQM